MFSCRTRGFCPSCHAKRLEEWSEWMRETLLLNVPHRQVVFTIPRMLRILFKYNRRLLGELCRSALRSLRRYLEMTTGSELMPGVIAAIQTFGARINAHPHLHFLVTEGGVDEAGLFRKVSRIDDVAAGRALRPRDPGRTCPRETPESGMGRAEAYGIQLSPRPSIFHDSLFEPEERSG